MEHLWYSFSRNGDFLQLAVVFMCNWNFSWPLADDWLSHIVTSDPVLHLHQPLPVYLNIPHSPLVISRTWPRSPFSSLQLPFRHFPLCNCHHSSSLVFFPSPSLYVFAPVKSRPAGVWTVWQLRSKVRPWIFRIRGAVQGGARRPCPLSTVSTCQNSCNVIRHSYPEPSCKLCRHIFLSTLFTKKSLTLS